MKWTITDNKKTPANFCGSFFKGDKMELFTKRCKIRNFRPEDAKDLHEVLSDFEVMKHIEPVFDMEKTLDFIKNAGLCEPPLVYAVEFNETEKVIGHLIFHSYENCGYEIGWVINKKYWGIGIANELTRKIIEYSKTLDIKSLIIEFDENQSASKHIAEKNGFVYEGKTGNIEIYKLML